MKRTWTKKQENWLIVNYPQAKSIQEVADKLKKPYGATKSKIKALGLKKSKSFFEWTEEKIDLLKKEYPTSKAKQVAYKLGCSLSVCHNKAFDLGIKKDKSFYTAMGNKLKECGKAHRFKKGYMPPNKGKKVEEFMSPKTLEKFRKKQFKKGNVPHNAKPVGHVSKHRDKTGKYYLFIKVEGSRALVLYHRYVWEKANGKIPDGYMIRFKDGNTENCELSNLECISKSENMVKNSIQNYPMEIKNIMRTTGKLKKIINNHKNQIK